MEYARYIHIESSDWVRFRWIELTEALRPAIPPLWHVQWNATVESSGKTLRDQTEETLVQLQPRPIRVELWDHRANAVSQGGLDNVV